MSNRWSIAELVRTLHRRHLTPRWLREQGTAPLPEAAAALAIRPDREDRSHADVYLGDHPRPPPAAGDGASVDVGGEPPGAVPGLVEVEVRVTGHLKRQRHGPGHALTKWIYVAGHGARRWCDPRYLVTRRSEWRPWVPRQGDHLGDGGRSREG